MKGNGTGVPWMGCGTALVTPFDEKGRIDFGSLEALVDWQITEGVDFLVPCGTTGESATLSRDERKAVTAAVVRASNGRVPVVAGAGGNHTARAVFWARDAAAAGADGILSATPMYNRPSPEGLVRHFSAIAHAMDLPILVGNEPGRTALDLDVETILAPGGDSARGGPEGGLVQFRQNRAADGVGARELRGVRGRGRGRRSPSSRSARAASSRWRPTRFRRRWPASSAPPSRTAATRRSSCSGATCR